MKCRCDNAVMDKSKPGRSFRRVTLLIFGLWLFLCSLFFVLADIEFQRDMENRSKETAAIHLSKALSLAQTLNRSFAQADTLLRLLKAKIETDGFVDSVYGNLLGEFLTTGIFNQIAVADFRGNLVFSAVPLKNPINISDRMHFRVHVASDSGKLYIAAPIVNQVAGSSSLFLSRRLNDAGGNFAGTVSVGIAPDYFSKEIAQLQPGSENTFVLLSTDGTFLARFPNVDSTEFRNSFKTHPVIAQVKQGVSSGLYESPGAGDGVARVGAFHSLSDYPAVVLVADSKNDAFRTVTGRGSDYRNYAGLVSLLLGLIFLFLWRQLRKQHQAEAELRRSFEVQHALREIAEAAIGAPSPEDLYKTVHTLVNRVLPAKNFYITLLDETTNQIMFPYCVDTANTVPQRRLAGKGLSDYVMRQRKAVCLTSSEIARLQESGEIFFQLLNDFKWAGAPLLDSTGRAFGVIALFSIAEEEQPLQEEDLEVLTIISAQVSLAIERRQAKETLRASEEKYRLIFEHAPMGLIFFDGQGVIAACNDFFTQIIGSSRKTLIGLNMLELPDKKLVLAVQNALNGCAGLYEEVYHSQTARKTTPVRCIFAPVGAGTGRIQGGVGIVEDVTEQRRSSEELRNTGEYLRKLIQYANAPIIVWNPEFIITRFNRAFERLSGYAADEVIGTAVSLLIPAGAWDETVELIERSRSGTNWESVEIPVRCKNGEMRIVLWNFANIYAADARTLTAVVAQGQDITERVRREQEINRDAKLATRVQYALLSTPKPSEYVDITTFYKPFGYVGGDLYFMDWRYEGSLLRGFLVDATGHGLSTALHTTSLHVLLREVNELDLPLADAMEWLNRRAGEYFDDGIFAGAMGFELDLQIRELRWACAGISKFWMNTKNQQGSSECPGMCLGIEADERFETHRIMMDALDSFYFMTHGMADLLTGRTDLPLDRHSDMVGVLRLLSESEDRRDDATAVCIHVRSLPESLVRQAGWPRIIRFNGYGEYQRFKGEVAKILEEVTGKPHSLQEVAVHEALANAMECRDGVARQQKAQIRFNKVGNRLIVRVKTSRIGFAGNAVLRRLRAHPKDMFSFGEDASMGRGIPMMLSMSHKMTYNSEGTELLLAWKL